VTVISQLVAFHSGATRAFVSILSHEVIFSCTQK